MFFIESDEDENNEEDEREGRGGDIQLTHLERAEMNRARVSGHVMSCDVPCNCHAICSGEDSKETGVWKLSEQTQRLPSGQRSNMYMYHFRLPDTDFEVEFRFTSIVRLHGDTGNDDEDKVHEETHRGR